MTLLILAAGMGSRYGGIKQLDTVGPLGETIMDYSIYDAKHAGFNKIVFVIRKALEEDFKEQIFPKYQDFIEIEYVFQELDDLPYGFALPKDRIKPWGTAHAVWVAKSKIEGNFAVINADDFYGITAYQAIFDFFNSQSDNSETTCLVTYELEKTTSKNGSVSRGICELDEYNNLLKIVEHTKIVEKENQLLSISKEKRIVLYKKSPTSMNLMGFDATIFPFIEKQLKLFLKENINSTDTEFFLPNILSQLIEIKKEKIQCIPTQEQWFGITYKDDKQRVIEEINKKIKANLYPKNLFH